MSKNGNGGEFYTGFIIGGLVGAALALLVAPQPGEETRAQLKGRGVGLKSQAEDWSGEIKHRAEAPRSKVAGLSAEVRQKADVAREEARKRAQVAAQEARKQAEQVRTRAEDLREKGRATLQEQEIQLETVVEQVQETTAPMTDEETA